MKKKKKRKLKRTLWWLGRVKTKPGVKLAALEPEALEALKIVYLLYKCLNRTLTVTSTVDGKHMPGSRHYRGLAFDTRVWGINKVDLQKLVYDSRELLGPNFDVINEVSHLHYEFDPKK